MNYDGFLYAFDLVSSLVFALSGALVGVRKRYNIFGIFMVALLTGISGGVLRSLLIGDIPIPFIADSTYLFTAFLATSCIYFLRTSFVKFTRLIKICDAIGLGFFFTSTMTVALTHQLGFISSIFIGVIGASGGGVIRDVLTSEIPYIFRKEVYILTCLIGGVLYFSLYLFPINRLLIMLTITFVIITLRILAIERNWSLDQ